jgi:hypothetical protein
MSASRRVTSSNDEKIADPENDNRDNDHSAAARAMINLQPW